MTDDLDYDPCAVKAQCPECRTPFKSPRPQNAGTTKGVTAVCPACRHALDMDRYVIEYGVLRLKSDVADPVDYKELIFDDIHPGKKDAAYVARRNWLFALTRKHRLEGLPPPIIDFTDEENRIWKTVYPELDELHRQHACRLYREGKQQLGMPADRVPQLQDVSATLTKATNMHLVPAEGPIDYRIFYRYIAKRGFPVTQFMRYGSNPRFTPEPDTIHDCLGHCPPLMNRDYAEMLVLIGRAATHPAAQPEHIISFKRFSWFSVEFGLIEEDRQVKVFGAGILSSIGEIPHSLKLAAETRDRVVHRPFITDEVINQDYDYSQMQLTFFIAPSLPFLRSELEKLVRRFNIPVL